MPLWFLILAFQNYAPSWLAGRIKPIAAPLVTVRFNHCIVEQVIWKKLLYIVCVSHSVMSDSLRPCGLWSARLLSPWNSPGKNTGVGSLSLLPEIFPTQILNPGLLYCRQILYCLSHQGSPLFIMQANKCILSRVVFLLLEKFHKDCF